MTRLWKTCAYCGRRMDYRKKWAGVWDEVRYCSRACRSRRIGATDRALEEAIMTLLSARGRGQSICPSEAARRVRPDGWRPLMEQARCAARRLVAAGRLEITQKGQRVDPGAARGPIRLRRPRR